MGYRNLPLLLVLLCAVSAVSCSGAAVPPTSAPTVATVPTVAPTLVATATSRVAAPTTAPTVAATVPPTSAPTAAPTQPAKATVPASGSASSASKPGTFGKADVDKIFPPGKGQDLVFQACVNCHNWVPLVLAGFDENGWMQNQKNHRNRVSSLSDADFEYLYQYLEKTFPAGHPVPTNIPEDLLKEWTSY
jgi:hypothetical protein